MKQNTKSVVERVLPYILLIGGIIGVLCAVVLTVEKINLLKNPGATLNCDLNPVVACGPVINTPQASAFGFPNPIIGLVGFGIVATVGAGLLAGATYKRWFWLCLQAGVTFGICFVLWLQYQSIFNIGALCPFCMVVWSVTIPIFWYTTLHNIRTGMLRLPRRIRSIEPFLLRHHGDILVAWYAVILLVILNHFWYYWSTLL